MYLLEKSWIILWIHTQPSWFVDINFIHWIVIILLKGANTIFFFFHRKIYKDRYGFGPSGKWKKLSEQVTNYLTSTIKRAGCAQAIFLHYNYHTKQILPQILPIKPCFQCPPVCIKLLYINYGSNPVVCRAVYVFNYCGAAILKTTLVFPQFHHTVLYIVQTNKNLNTSAYLFSFLNVAILPLQICIFLPVPITVWVTLEKSIECLSCRRKLVLHKEGKYNTKLAQNSPPFSESKVQADKTTRNNLKLWFLQTLTCTVLSK